MVDCPFNKKGMVFLGKMRIKSFYGDYFVHFTEEIDYNNIVKDGDIVVIDQVVYDLYEKDFYNILNEKNTIKIDATERQKSYEGLIPIMEEVIHRGFHKNNTLIAIGGGITQDIVAFMASILYRGVKWELIPTTLLAQCDSCIGSKTSINFSSYKNQVGGFYPAGNVYIAPHFLKTLSEKEIKSGLGEMLHYYVVGGEEDFDYFSANYVQSMNDSHLLQQMIKRSLEIKKRYIEIDEYDKNERQIFNYGHSFGHAIETMTNYNVPHGIAVAYGMDIANYISVKNGIQKNSVREKIRNVIKGLLAKGVIEKFDVNEYIKLLGKDKKNEGERLGIILCADFGNLSKYMVYPDQEFCQLLINYFAHEIA